MHYSAFHIVFLCSCQVHLSHSRSTAGSIHLQKQAAQGSIWRETSKCPATFFLEISAEVPGENLQWIMRSSAGSWRCLRLQTGPQPPGLDATYPSSPVELTHCTENKQKGRNYSSILMHKQACQFLYKLLS